MAESQEALFHSGLVEDAKVDLEGCQFVGQQLQQHIVVELVFVEVSSQF